MNSATTLTAAAAEPPRTHRLLGIYVLLIIIAVVETFDGLSGAPILFSDMSEIPGPGLGGAIIKAYIASHPVLALTALALAATGHVRYAIMALGALVMMTWLNYMPSVVLHGFDVGGIAGFETVAQIIAFPLMAACAIALAARNRQLGVAAALVSIPTLFGLFGILAFAIGIALHGF
ncbi:MAG: hypothetical protein K2X57_21185 [Xanthobacteraceae bacterium]|nr:hypothetical protein [Xanthobacteraceae bacterium]